MTTATILPLPRACFFDANGNPLASGLVYTYVANTTTPKQTWQDAGETTPNTNPIVLDANGSCLLYGSGSYTLTVTDALGNNIPAYSGLTVDTLSQAVALINAAIALQSPAVTNIAALRAATSTSLTQSQCYVLGYTTAADGGQGEFLYVASDVTSTDNSGTIIVDASNRRWYRDTQGNPLNVQWFGALGNGTTDDTTAIQAALNVVTNGGIIYFPAGAYKVTATLNAAPVVYMDGDGYNTTRIISAATTGDVVSFTGGTAGTFGGGITNLCVDTSVTRTSGAALFVSNIQDFIIDRFSVNGTAGGTHHDGIRLVSTSGLCFQTRITDFSVRSCTNIGLLLGDSGTGANGAVGDLEITNGIITACNFGIWAENLSGFYWANIDVLASTTAGITCTPSSGSNQSVTFGLLTNVLADSTSNGPGWNFDGTGFTADLALVNCWGSSNHTSGFVFDRGIASLSLTNCIATNNQQHGFEIMKSGDLRFTSCTAEANSQASSATYHGWNIEANAGGFQISNCLSGKAGYVASTSGVNPQGYGICVQSGTSDIFIITNCRFPSNQTGGFVNGGSGSNIVVTNNLNF